MTTSSRVSVQLPDGSHRELDAGATIGDLAADIGPGLARAALIGVIDGVEHDLDVPLVPDGRVEIVTPDSDRGLFTLRHSTADVLAQAVLDLWPGATFAIGPPIQDGFYYDFELPEGATFTEEDLERIDARMREIIEADQPFVRAEMSAPDATDLFADHPYKREIIDAADASEVSGDDVISTYRNTEGFIDLCRGPHVPSTGRLGHFALMHVAGAYWRGDEHRPMLQRIYGTAWADKKQLKQHLHRLEEAAKRDHRRLANELDLVSFPSELGGGLAVWHPKGAIVRRVMEDYSRDRHASGGYDFVYTPNIANGKLFETSGHLDFYADSMYPPMEMDNGVYYPKPMNCPMHVLVFRSGQRSYRELPVRFFELGTVYRYERAGTLHGLMRIRGFTQDDAHIFCTREQLADELAALLDFVLSVLRAFGFEDFDAKLSTRPDEKCVGSVELWDDATDALRQAIDASGLDYEVDEGAGAFYGPKIDVDVRDAIGRSWQLSTIQVDFNLPERFGLEYVGSDGDRHQPVMVHRALFGSVERFFGVLLEHYAGAFPAWLAPVQTRLLPVAADHDAYAQSVAEKLADQGIRVDVVRADEPLGKRIRNAKVEKLPYVLVVGDDDVAAGTVGVNPRGGDVERDVPVEEFATRLLDDVEATGSGMGDLDRIWAGWRERYLSGADEVPPGEGTLFERLLHSDLPDEDTRILWRGDRVFFAVLNAYPYTTGHLMVLPNRALTRLDELDADESLELWRGVVTGVAAIEAAYSPDGVNVGANIGRAAGAGIPDHLHVHCLPRWSGDTNFITTVAQARVMPEPLDESWRKLRDCWPHEGAE